MDPNYKAKYREIRRRNTYKKVQHIKDVFNDLFLHKSEMDVLKMLSQCSRQYYGQKSKPLNEETKVMYEYLVSHNYNPFTVYKWFLMFINPEMIEQYIERGTISQEKMRKTIRTKKSQRDMAVSWKFMEEARKVVMEMMLYV